MKSRYLIITLLLTGISLVHAQEAKTERLTARSDATKINWGAAAETLGKERSRLSDPIERQAFLSNALVQVEQSNGRLFEALSKAAPAKLVALKPLMSEAMLAMHLAHLSDQAEGGTITKGKGLSLAQTRSENEKRIHALLGDDGYAIYVAYQQSEPYRNTIEQLAKAMRTRGSAITAEQEQALLDCYVDALLTAAEDSVKEVSPEVYAAEQRTLGQVELCGRAAVIGPRQRQRFEFYLAATVSEILSPADFKRFQQARAQPESRPDWRDYVPSQYSQTP